MELIRSLILLGEHADIEPHLRTAPRGGRAEVGADPGGLGSSGLHRRLDHIEDYLRRSTALVLAGDVEQTQLKLLLRTLELRLEALHNEKTDLERRLVLFNHRHDLGEWILRVLRARAELARLRDELSVRRGNPTAHASAHEQAEAEQARFHEYARDHETLRQTLPPPTLDAEATREIKRLYRQQGSQL